MEALDDSEYLEIELDEDLYNELAVMRFRNASPKKLVEYLKLQGYEPHDAGVIAEKIDQEYRDHQMESASQYLKYSSIILFGGFGLLIVVAINTSKLYLWPILIILGVSGYLYNKYFSIKRGAEY